MKIGSENKIIIKRIIGLFRPYKGKVIVIFTCMLMSAGVSMLMPKISQQLMDRGLLAQNFKLLVMFTLAGMSLLLIQQGLGFIEARNQIYLNSVIPFTLSKNAFKHTLRLRMQYFSNANFGEIMSTIGMDVGNIARVCDRSTFFILESVFKIIGGFVGLLIVDWKLTALVAFIVPFRYIVVKYIAKKRKLYFEEMLNLNKEFGAFYGDTLGGIKEIKLWGLDRIKVGQFIKKQRGIISSNIKMGLLDKINEFSETVLFRLITDLIYIVGAYLIFGNSLTIGELFAFITYSSYVTGPISSILNIGYNFVNIIPSAKRYFNFLDMECEPYNGIKGRVGFRDKNSQISIKYDNVSFSYTSDRQSLSNVSFEINDGEKVAVVGHNGSGKSTIINLLLRFYTPGSGRITVNGTDINTLDLREYREMISVVSQDIYLFDSTIKENIALNSKASELSIHKAARESGAHEFIDNLPDKYNANAGRNGACMSGGEKQKVAFARALVRKSKILILDEATSNYDIASEIEVNKFVGKELEGKTLVIISHKPDVLKYVDKIIVLEEGRIVDIGKHDELLIKSDIYKSMVQSHDVIKGKKAI